jgi:ethanolamine utilization protein EutN
MQIAKVIGTVVSTQKHRKFEGAKLMLVQPLNIDDSPRGNALLAVDGVGAGVDEKVLVVLEGRAAGEALGRKAAPVDAAIVGIIDTVTIDD